MIDGTVLAPFMHDSTWPDKEVEIFRKAVYYFHVHAPGRDPVTLLRKLALQKPWKKEDKWGCIKIACDKVIHLAITDVDDGQIAGFVKNLLIFTNLVLIQEHGFQRVSSVRIERINNIEKTKEDERNSEIAWSKYIESIDLAYASLESSIHALDKGRGRLTVGESDMLSPVSAAIPCILIEPEDDYQIVCQIDSSDTDRCVYEFRPDDPVGWVMMGGNLSYDKFADNITASLGV